MSLGSDEKDKVGRKAGGETTGTKDSGEGQVSGSGRPFLQMPVGTLFQRIFRSEASLISKVVTREDTQES